MQSSDTRHSATPANRNSADGRDIAIANATSNFFLGVAQKPWMSDDHGHPNPSQPIANTQKEKPSKGVAQGNPAGSTSIPPSIANASHDSNTNTSELVEEPNTIIRPPRKRRPSLPSTKKENLQSHRHNNGDPSTGSFTAIEYVPLREQPQSPNLQTTTRAMTTTIGMPQDQLTSVAGPSVQGSTRNGVQCIPNHPQTNGHFLPVQAPPSMLFMDMHRCNETLVNLAGGWNALDDVSRMRIRELTSAIQQEDQFYLVIHQLMSMANLDRTAFCQLPYMTLPQIAGLDAVAALFIDNTSMRRDILSHCANFPYSQIFFAQSFSTHPLLLCVSRFLSHFGQAWPQFRQHCLQRGCPPFPEEQLGWLRLNSPSLQTILFTALHRQLGAVDNSSWSRQCLWYFGESQKALSNPTDPATAPLPLNFRVQLYQQVRSAGLSISSRMSQQQRVNGQGSTQPQQSPTRPQSTTEAGSSHSYLPSRPTTVNNQASINSTASSNSPVTLQIPNIPLPLGPGTSNSRSGTGLSTNLGESSHVPVSNGMRSQGASSRNLGLPPPLPNHGLQIASTYRYGSMNGLQPAFSASTSANGNQPVGAQEMPALEMRPVQSVHEVSSALLPDTMADSDGRTPSDASQLAVNSLLGQMSDPFFAKRGFELAQSNKPNPCRRAIHQAYLRSPVALKVDHTSRHGPDDRMYQYLTSYALTPKYLGGERSFHDWNFPIAAADWNRRALMVKQATLTEPPQRLYKDGACLFRLRCVSVSPQENIILEHEWNARATAWPSSCFISCNDQQLELRRKVHYGRDLAVDLTNFMKEGDNNITFSILRSREEASKRFYAVAVEIIDVADEQQVRGAVGMITVKESLRMITDTISRPEVEDGNDDDVMVTDSHINVDLRDPFTTRLFETPARSGHCRHRECFDLETFLHTRPSRGSEGLSSADVWKCPLCRVDARPTTLLIDGFLQDVGRELREKQTLGARAIRVKGDGTWDVIKDSRLEKNMKDTGDLKAMPPRERSVEEEGKAPVERVLIELDDDND